MTYVVSRRDFVAALLASSSLAGAAPNIAAAGDDPPGDIERIEHLGPYFDQCSLPGERRRDGVVPRHATCIQVARARWLVLYSTHA